jgi:phosphate uptake regulator
MTMRKLQRTGGGTFFVCLPKEWAERLNLKRGSVVAVAETADGRLLIDPKYEAERQLQAVTLEPSDLLDREIVGKYLLGYDVIRVEAKEQITTKQRELIKQAVSRLVGLEIVEEDYKSIVMQCLLDPEIPPDRILHREYTIAAGMHHDAVTAMVNGDVHLADNVAARDDDVNRHYFLLVRIIRTVIRNPRLSERLKITALDCLDYRLVASFVEGLGDQSVQIAETVKTLKGIKLGGNISQILLKLHRAVFNAHENALKAFLTHDIELAESIRDEREGFRSLMKDVETLAKNEQDVNIVGVVVSAAETLGRIYELSVDIADLVMPKLTE